VVPESEDLSSLISELAIRYDTKPVLFNPFLQPTSLSSTLILFSSLLSISTELIWYLESYIQSVGLFGRVISPVARSLPAHTTPQTRNKRTQTSMPRVRFESTITVFERAKTFHALGWRHTQRHRSYGKMSYDFFAVRPSESQNWIASPTWGCGSRTVDAACRHVRKLRLHFTFYYLMRHESYGRRATDVAVCEGALRLRGRWGRRRPISWSKSNIKNSLKLHITEHY
jgi:hypothetical protein